MMVNPASLTHNYFLFIYTMWNTIIFFLTALDKEYNDSIRKTKKIKSYGRRNIRSIIINGSEEEGTQMTFVILDL